MKPRTSTKQRKKLNFSVDRGEVDITSDWVDSVMVIPPGRSVVSDGNTATDALSATDVSCAPVADSATEVQDASVAVSATHLHLPVEQISGPVGLKPASNVINSATVEQNATGEQTPAVEQIATVEEGVSGIQSARKWHPRPIRSITDGLTTGQYAVYSVMYAYGEPGEAGQRLYRGGYKKLSELAGMSKRGLQNVIGELRHKRVIQLHTAPGHRPLDTSAYTILAGSDVVELWKSHGWRFAVGKSKTLTAGE